MKMDNSTVINLCGNYPENFEKADVLSDHIYKRRVASSIDLINVQAKRFSLNEQNFQ